MGLGTFLDLSANDLARFRLPFGLLESFRSDYFDVSFSSSLRLEDTPLESREAKVFVNLVLTCAPQFVITTVFDA